MWDSSCLNFATEEIVDIENKEISSLLIMKVVLGCLEQITKDFNNKYMSGGLDVAFEIEIVYYFCFGVYKIQESSWMIQLWTIFK